MQLDGVDLPLLETSDLGRAGLSLPEGPGWEGVKYTPRGTTYHGFVGCKVQRLYSLLCRCNRLRCPLARMSGLQCFNMGHNGHGINLYGVSMTLMEN